MAKKEFQKMKILEGYFLIASETSHTHNPIVRLMLQDEIIKDYEMGIELWVVIADASDHKKKVLREEME